MLVLAGTIGAGKSSLATALGKHFGTDVYYESVGDNPVLELYYQDREKYAFLLQVYFLNKRFKNIKEACKHNNDVLDRSIYEDALFLDLNYKNGMVTKQEHDIYHELLDNMLEELEGLPKKAPDLLIYIDVDFDTMLKRIKGRGRDFEQIENNDGLYDYYKNLLAEYEPWYDAYDKSPKIKINGSKYDFVNNEDDLKDIIKQIEDKLKEVRK